MKLIATILFLFSFASYSQIVLHGGGKIKINGGISSSPIFMVLNNSPSTPITTSGTSDGIIMESEYNRLQYNLKTGTTAITVPYMSNALEQFPLTLTPTTSGIGSGNIRFSSTVAPTRSSGWDNTSYLPSDVANMGAPSVTNNSAKSIDRFWIIDANSYTTKPAVTLAFTYLDAEWQTNAGNSIIESNLQAQRFNSTINDWEGYSNFPPTGTINIVSNTLSGVSVQPTDFFRSWTLNDNSVPLPIELLYFEATCTNGKMTFNWCTASETNNNYFIIEKSLDANSFQVLGTVQGSGTSTVKHCYSFVNNSNESNITYYRLKQIDINGNYKYSNIISVNCSNENTSDFNVFPNPNNGAFTIVSSEMGIYIIVNELGQTVQQIAINEANNLQANINGLRAGIYFIIGKMNDFVVTKKMVITD